MFYGKYFGRAVFQGRGLSVLVTYSAAAGMGAVLEGQYAGSKSRCRHGPDRASWIREGRNGARFLDKKRAV